MDEKITTRYVVTGVFITLLATSILQFIPVLLGGIVGLVRSFGVQTQSVYFSRLSKMSIAEVQRDIMTTTFQLIMMLIFFLSALNQNDKRTKNLMLSVFILLMVMNATTIIYNDSLMDKYGEFDKRVETVNYIDPSATRDFVIRFRSLEDKDDYESVISDLNEILLSEGVEM